MWAPIIAYGSQGWLEIKESEQTVFCNLLSFIKIRLASVCVSYPAYNQIRIMSRNAKHILKKGFKEWVT